MFSGQIAINNNKKIFQWFVEAQSNADKAPVLLWTNGGPGCSGLGGFLSEMGPFNASKNGLTANEQAWNKLANMVFIEQPAGVGFSKTGENQTGTGDDQAAEDNHEFIKSFFEKFDDLKSHDFQLTSESYGGHQLPTLAWHLVSKGGVDNFKGFAVGNPLTWMPQRNMGQQGTWCGHQLIPRDICENYRKNGCDKDTQAVTNPSEDCQHLTNQMDTLTSKLNPYALDFPTCPTSGPLSSEVEQTTVRHFQRFIASITNKTYPKQEPCAMGQGGQQLNRKDVQAAIHAMPTKWNMCSDVKQSNEDTLKPMMPYQKELMGKIKMMVYSGDDDSVCATDGSQRWIWQVGGEPEKDWGPWTVVDPVYGEQIAGYSVHFKGFSFYTVHGAGHMVPQTKPVRGFELLKNFLMMEQPQEKTIMRKTSIK